MQDARRIALVLLLVGSLFAGCSSGSSTSKGYDHLVAAAQAIGAGDKEAALSELSASIENSPSAWAYFERARIHLEKGQEQDAILDCKSGLELDPKDRNLLWLSGELKKPAAQRFKGAFAKPPVHK
jgi:hypothetical protein